MCKYIENLGLQKKLVKGEYYYKIDENGYPSLSEYVVSHLFKYSNISDYVLYDVVKIDVDGTTKIACKSKNFLKDDEEVITVQRIYHEIYNKSVEEDLIRIPDIKERIKYIVDLVEIETKISDFGKYLTSLLQIDKYFLNDDRHFDNIAVIRNSKNEYRLCPVFDNGAMLLSATNVYNLDDSIEKNINKMFCFPFSINFDEQVNAAVSLYGDNFSIKFTEKIIDDLLNDVKILYDDKVISRVKEILYRKILRYNNIKEGNL